MKKRLFNLRLLFTLIVVFESTCYAVIVAQQVAAPYQLNGIDYIAIYTGGYIAHYDGLIHVYDLSLQQRVEAAAALPLQLARFYPYNHPPFLIQILEWITTSDLTGSFSRWVLVLFAFHMISLVLLANLMKLSGWNRKQVWIASISGLLFYPIFSTYLKGQDSTFLLLGAVLWTYGLLTEKDMLAGLGLAVTALRPQIALMLAIPFLFNRRKVVWWFVGWGSSFLIYFFLLIGEKGLKDFVQLLFLTASGMGIDVDKMPTLMGSVVRAFPGIPAFYLNCIGYSGYALAILFLCIIWKKSQHLQFKHVGVAILLSTFFSPHLHFHDLSLLLIPTLGAAAVLIEHKILSKNNAVLLPLMISLVLLISQVFLAVDIFWSYLIIYLSMLLLGFLLWWPGWRRIYYQRQIS